MSERAEEIRRKFHTTAIRDLLAALAQAERERDEWRQKALGVTERLSEREEFIRQNAGQLLAERDEKIKNQRNTLRRLTAEAASLHAETERLRAKLEGAKRFGDIQLAEKRALVARLEHVESEHARETRNGFESWRALHAENERLRALVMNRLPKFDTPEWDAKETELITEAEEMTDLIQLREHYVCAMLNWSTALDERDALEARTRALEVALYRGANAFDFWLRWAEGRGAITQASRDVYEHMRAALTEPAPPASESEGMLLRRLSDLLTGGNAGTWDEIEHAIATLTAEAASLHAETERLRADNDLLRKLADFPLTPTGSKALERAEARTRALEAEIDLLHRELDRANAEAVQAGHMIVRKNAALARPCIACGYEPKMIRPAALTEPTPPQEEPR